MIGSVLIDLLREIWIDITEQPNDTFCCFLLCHVRSYTAITEPCQQLFATFCNFILVEGNSMKLLDFPAMTKKADFIHIRSDEELKAALEADAAKHDRKLTDHARYLLRVALGLSEGAAMHPKKPGPIRPPDDVATLQERIEQLEREVRGSRKHPKKRAG